jgi:hypothetical protein
MEAIIGRHHLQILSNLIYRHPQAPVAENCSFLAHLAKGMDQDKLSNLYREPPIK